MNSSDFKCDLDTKTFESSQYIEYIWINSLRPYWIENKQIVPEAQDWIVQCSEGVFALLAYKIGSDKEMSIRDSCECFNYLNAYRNTHK